MSRALIRAFALTVACVALAAVSALAIAHFRRFNTQLSSNGLGIVRHPKPRGQHRGAVTLLPRDHVTCSTGRVADFCGRDLSGADLTRNLSDLLSASFDSQTTWPPRLPLAFDPEHVMSLGKTPGLGMQELHMQGITGRGVGVAVIGPAPLVDHAEYAGRLRLYEELHCADATATADGSAAASLAVGRTVGVAPEASLYYIAETHVSDRAAPPGAMVDLTVVAQCIDRMRETNRRLPADRKIRAIAVPAVWETSDYGYQEVAKAIWAADADGIFVISPNLGADRGLYFGGAGRDPLDDPNDVDSYGPARQTRFAPLQAGAGAVPLLVPLDSRCMASAGGISDYAFRREGSWGFMTPYLAGLYALACQIRPDITPEEFWATATQTGDPIHMQEYGRGRLVGRLVNPRRLIKALQHERLP